MSRFQIIVCAGVLAVGLLGGRAEAGNGGKVAVLGVEGDQSGQVEDALTSIVEDEHEVISAHAFEQAADKAGVKDLDTKGIAKVAKRLAVAAVLESVMTRQDDGYQLLVRVRTAAGKTTKKLTVVMPGKKLSTKDRKSLGDRVLAALDDIDPHSGRARGDVSMSEDEREVSTRRLKKMNGIGDADADSADDDAGASASDDDEGDQPIAKHAKKSKKADRAAKAAKAKAEKADKAKADKEDADAVADDERADADDRDAKADRGKHHAAKDKRADRDDRDGRDDRADADDGAGDDKGKGRGKRKDRRVEGATDRDMLAMRDDADADGGARASSDDDDAPRSRRSEDRADRGDGDDDGDGISAHAHRGHGARPIEGAIVEAGASVTGRSLTFTTRAGLTQAPTGYKGPYVPGAHVAGELYPLAFVTDRSSALAGLGVDFEYDKTISLTTRSSAAMDVAMPTTEKHWMVGARYRLAFGHKATSPQVSLGVDYGRRVFSVDRSGLPVGSALDLPDVDYKMIAPELAVRLPIGARVTLTAGGHALLFQSAGAIQTQAEYGAAKITGADGTAGVEVAITSNVMLHVTGYATMIGYSFVGNGVQTNNRDNDPATKDVGGALDRYLGGSATLGFTY